MGEKSPAKTSGLSYSVAALFIFAVSFFALFVPQSVWTTQGGVYLNFLVSQIAFLLVAVWFFVYTKTPIKGFIRSQKCHPKYFLAAFVLQIGLLSLAELNGVFLKLLGEAGYTDSEIQIPSTSGIGYLGVLFVVAALPAFFEELFFRGVLLSGMKDFSFAAKLLICGGLFALYHQNPAQTIYQFCCGIGFALVAIKAGSFLPTVLAHFINNALVVTLYKFGITSYPKPVFVALMCVSALCLVGVTVYLLVFDKKKETEEKAKWRYAPFFAYAGVGIFIFALSWLTTLIAGL